MMADKPKRMSRTKIGAVIVGVGVVLATIGGMVQGSVDMTTGATAIIEAVGAVLIVFGIRGLPIFNR